MQIIKQGSLKSTRDTLRFFKEHFDKVDKVKYIVLYFAEREWLLNPDLYHQYAIVIGENAQLWMSGLTWGYCGEGPYGLFEVMQMIDPSITFEQIEALEWPGTYPILFENVEGRLSLTQFTNSVASLLCLEGGRLPWFPL
ncbi:unnamed protein product [marine sediment metagenome]|uniref:Uncharacterized protein n=2 Tax=marine sediment metagenome TaxID=412755 RepID=X1APC9_9ZZZZ